MYLVRGRLDPEVGALLMRALEAAGDALFRKETAEEIEPTHRRADAMGLLAERALAVGFGGAGAAGEEAENAEDAKPAEEEAADREAARPTPLSGSRAERYQVVLHVEAPTLARERHTGREGGPRESSPGSSSESGRSELEDGTRVSAGNVSEALVRRRCGPDHRGPGRLSASGKAGARCRPEGAYDPAFAQAGARVPRPWMSLPGLWPALHRRPSHRALGGRRPDQPAEPSPAVPIPSPPGARGGLHSPFPSWGAVPLSRSEYEADPGSAAGDYTKSHDVATLTLLVTQDRE